MNAKKIKGIKAQIFRTFKADGSITYTAEIKSKRGFHCSFGFCSWQSEAYSTEEAAEKWLARKLKELTSF